MSVLLRRLVTEADTAVGEVRRIVDGLRPAVLDDLGLGAALRRHAADLPPGLHLDVDATDLEGVPPEVEVVVYRIAREAVTNVARHALAERARLSVLVAEGAVRLEVEDDGTGLTKGISGGVGIASMRHRAESVGGTLDVVSSEAGTTLVVILPLQGCAR